MKAYHKKRMQKLIDFLRELPREKFNYNQWIEFKDYQSYHPCKTVCSATGWLPKIDPRNWIVRKNYEYSPFGVPVFKWDIGSGVYSNLSKYFGISYDDVLRLFVYAGKTMDYWENRNGLNKITPKKIARVLQNFLDKQP